MGDINGFLKIKRKDAGNRPVSERIYDHSEIEQILNSEDRMLQAARCMDCGVAFCHWSCPVDNLIPEWNELLQRGDWKAAYQRLYATNTFPEVTGRICPAPCEHSCVLTIGFEPVTIRENEVAIAERAFAEGYVRAQPPGIRSGKKVAVIGSGPAGLSAADLLNRKGHTVTVFEKDDRAGGLLRYGIPDFKLNKSVIDRRLDLLKEEGVIFRTGVDAGKDISAKELIDDFDAVCLAMGSSVPRDINVEGRNMNGIFFAMDYLTRQNRINAGQYVEHDPTANAEGKNVVVIGGGDTGSDCVGTAIRQKAGSVVQIEIMPKPPVTRAEDNPWPFYAKMLKTSTSHEEGCTRYWSVSALRFTGTDNNVTGVEIADVSWEKQDGKYTMNLVPGTTRIIEAGLVLIAAGFLHPSHEGIVSELGLKLDGRRNILTGENFQTGIPKIFAAGDAKVGASLVVTAIASGRKAAGEIHRYLECI
jgi:glutamate synthase (NADPH) small chain